MLDVTDIVPLRDRDNDVEGVIDVVGVRELKLHACDVANSAHIRVTVGHSECRAVSSLRREIERMLATDYELL